MRSNFPICRTAWLSLLLSLFWWGQALGAARTVIVHVDVPPLAWSGSTLEMKLIKHLSLHENGRFMTAPDRISVFDRLEEKLALRVVERVGKVIRLR